MRILRLYLIVWAVVLAWALPVSAQVSIGSSCEAPTASTPNTNAASFTITCDSGASPNGGFVCTYNLNSGGTHDATAVDWGGIAGTAVSGGLATTTAGDEDGSVQLWKFASIPSGSQTITITRNNNANEMYATAGSVDTVANTAEIYEAGIVLIQAVTNPQEQNVDDGSPGTNSLRYLCAHIGPSTVPTGGANSTPAVNIDVGAHTAGMYFESAVGQGSRPIGVADLGGNDDFAGVFFAMRQAAAAGTNCADGPMVGVARCK